MNDAAMLYSDGLYRIIPKSDIASGVTVPGTAEQENPGTGTQIFSLNFISASEMKKLLDPVVADGNAVVSDESRNLIIASGTSGELRAIRETIDIFDLDWM